ncbi:unnamed protein product [Caenorhabditis auriculariae]|uniref:Uncharacterized protein n=1 Tax=Caenorhabditis auriculariae TaxID=2777116 RepID=A0A8S1H3C0_9PELO|nr:unnamed protein product [Caenorhabditis auriculariae]
MHLMHRGKRTRGDSTAAEAVDARSCDVRVVKELDLKSNGHCPRRQKMRIETGSNPAVSKNIFADISTRNQAEIQVEEGEDDLLKMATGGDTGFLASENMTERSRRRYLQRQCTWAVSTKNPLDISQPVLFCAIRLEIRRMLGICELF